MKAYDPHRDLCEFVTVKTFHYTAPFFYWRREMAVGAEAVHRWISRLFLQM